MHMTPVMTESVIARDTCRTASPPASGITTLATMAQVAASGATINCRDVPNTAYATSGRMLAYRPLTGGTPASCE